MFVSQALLPYTYFITAYVSVCVLVPRASVPGVHRGRLPEQHVPRSSGEHVTECRHIGGVHRGAVGGAHPAVQSPGNQAAQLTQPYTPGHQHSHPAVQSPGNQAAQLTQSHTPGHQHCSRNEQTTNLWMPANELLH